MEYKQDLPGPEYEIDPVSHFGLHELENWVDETEGWVTSVVAQLTVREIEGLGAGILPAIWIETFLSSKIEKKRGIHYITGIFTDFRQV